MTLAKPKTTRKTMLKQQCAHRHVHTNRKHTTVQTGLCAHPTRYVKSHVHTDATVCIPPFACHRVLANLVLVGMQWSASWCAAHMKDLPATFHTTTTRTTTTIIFATAMATTVSHTTPFSARGARAKLSCCSAALPLRRSSEHGHPRAKSNASSKTLRTIDAPTHMCMRTPPCA